MRKIYYIFLKYVGFNILGMLFLSGYILADTYFISKAFGAQGLAALNFSISVFSIITATGLMLGIGGATKFSFFKASDEDKKANQIFSLTVVSGLVISVIFVIIGIFYSHELAKLLGANSEIIGLTSIYLKTILIFAPAFIVNNILLAFIRNDHAPKLAMFGMVSGSLLNIVLDYIFIFSLKMGMFGAAFATCIAPLISITVSLFHFILRKNTFKPVRTPLLPSTVKDIVSLGSSTFITELSSSIALIVFNLVIFKITGNIGVAAYGIIANISLVILAIFNGIAQGIQPLVSRSFGQGEYRCVRSIGKLAIVFSLIISLAVYGISLLFTKEIIGIFNSQGNAELNMLAQRGIIIYFFGFFFAGINIVSAAYLSSQHRPKPAFIISISRACLAIIPLVILLSLLFDMDGVWLSFVLAEFVTLVISFINTRKYIF